MSTIQQKVLICCYQRIVLSDDIIYVFSKYFYNNSQIVIIKLLKGKLPHKKITREN